MEMNLKLTHLYPHDMNIYGDCGNIIALTKRMEWRGIQVIHETVQANQPYDFTRTDMVFAGGGQDKGQMVVANDLRKKATSIHEAVQDDVVFLTICGAYQLFGHRFVTVEQDIIPGIGVFDAETLGSNHRMVGNVVIDTSFGQLVGFENHSGETILAKGQAPLGTVVKGYGNNLSRKDEGAVKGNAFGSYLHGSLLPKNPDFADELIKRALMRKYGSAELEQLDNQLEHRAHKSAQTRPQ